MERKSDAETATEEADGAFFTEDPEQEAKEREELYRAIGYSEDDELEDLPKEVCQISTIQPGLVPSHTPWE